MLLENLTSNNFLLIFCIYVIQQFMILVLIIKQALKKFESLISRVEFGFFAMFYILFMILRRIL